MKSNLPFLTVLLLLLMVTTLNYAEASDIPAYIDIIKDRPVEFVCVFNQAGNILFVEIGTENSVYLSARQVQILKGNIVIHNHPNQNVQYSTEDLYMHKSSGALETWVVTNHSIGKLRGTSTWTIESLPIRH